MSEDAGTGSSTPTARGGRTVVTVDPRTPSPKALRRERTLVTLVTLPAFVGLGALFGGGAGAAALGAALGAGFFGLAAAITMALSKKSRSKALVRGPEGVVVDDDLPSLPLGGTVLVRRAHSTMQGKHGPVTIHSYSLEYRHGRETLPLYADAHDPLAVRSFAEALAYLAEGDIEWEGPHETTERRSSRELNRSIIDRHGQGALPPFLPPRPPAVEVDEHQAVVVLAHRAENTAAKIGITLAVALGLAASRFEAWPLAMAAPLLLAFVAHEVASRIEVMIGPASVHARWRVFGLFPSRIVRADLNKTESLIVGTTPTQAGLLFLDDDTLQVIPCTFPEAAYLRALILRRVADPGSAAWRDQAARRALAPQPEAGPTPAAAVGTTALALGDCPRCAETLTRVGGPLDEHRCACCDGRLLPPSGTERLVEHELGIDRQLLREVMQVFKGQRLGCPSCGAKMQGTRIKGEQVDLCPSCGALWLDEGELQRISAGRYEELKG